MISLAWLLAWQIASARTYHELTLEDLADGTRWTHACVTGPVVYRRKQADGDWHVTLDNGRAKVVLEIVPAIPLPAPRKGETVRACGVTRFDVSHSWWELHPVETLAVVAPALRKRKAQRYN